MSEDSKRNAVIAGALATVLAAGAAVGVSTTGVPADPSPTPDGVYAQATSTPGLGDAFGALADAVRRLEEKARARGMELPETEDGETVGINSIIEGLDGMISTSGETMELQVSKAGTVFQGDYVKLCREFGGWSETRFANGDTVILAAQSAQLSVPQTSTRVAVVYAQDGDTKLRLMDVSHSDGRVAMKNTVTVLEGQVPDSVALCADETGASWLIFYALDGDGLVSHVATDRYSAYVTGTDIWMDGGDAWNISVCGGRDRDLFGLACSYIPEGKTEDEDRVPFFMDGIWDAGRGLRVFNAVELTPERYPALQGMAVSTDEYAQGWAVGCSQDADTYEAVFSLSLPTPEDDGRSIVTVYQPYPYGKELTVTGWMPCLSDGSVPSAAAGLLLSGDTLHNIGITMLAHGVTRMDDSGKIKSLVGAELCASTKEGSVPTVIWAGELPVGYNTNVSRVSCGGMGEGGGFLAYASGNAMYAAVMDLRAHNVIFGPAVNIGTFTDFGTVVPVGSAYAAYVYQKDGEGRIRVYHTSAVVCATDLAHADGKALEAGGAGKTIRVDVLRKPNYFP